MQVGNLRVHDSEITHQTNFVHFQPPVSDVLLRILGVHVIGRVAARLCCSNPGNAVALSRDDELIIIVSGYIRHRLRAS